MKDVNEWLTEQDFLNLMQDKTDRRICLTECIIYIDDAVSKVFTRQFWGEIAREAKGTGSAIERVAVFNGATIGQHAESGRAAFEAKDYIWDDFAQWFVTYDA